MSVKTRVRRGVTEFFVVVFGVGVALAGENWIQGRRDGELAQKYVLRLEAELTEGAPLLSTNFRRVESSFAAIDTLLTLEDDGSAYSRLDSLRLVLDAAGYGFNAQGAIFDHTYREMLATGTLNLIENDELRTAISDYYRFAYRLEGVMEQAGEAGMREWLNRVKATTGNVGDARRNPEGIGMATSERILAPLRTGEAWTQLRTTYGALVPVRVFLGRLDRGTQRLLEAF